MTRLEDKKAAIAARIRLAREQAGLTQGQVARLMGMHRPSISEVEAGRRNVTSAELATLAEIYGVDLNWLSCLDSDSIEQGRIELAARKLANLTPEALDSVLALLRTLTSKQEE